MERYERHASPELQVGSWPKTSSEHQDVGRALDAKERFTEQAARARRDAGEVVDDNGSIGAVRFAFARGGKDGTPFPLDCETYDRTMETLNAA